MHVYTIVVVVIVVYDVDLSRVRPRQIGLCNDIIASALNGADRYVNDWEAFRDLIIVSSSKKHFLHDFQETSDRIDSRCQSR